MRLPSSFLAVCVAFAASTANAAAPASLTVPSGFTIEQVASVERARELTFAPNGDLFVGTLGGDVVVVPSADETPGTPRVFSSLPDAPVAGVATDGKTLYAGTQHGIYALPMSGDHRAVRIASVRPGNGKDHLTTSLALDGERLYASVGSSCNACTESDPTRATIQEIDLADNVMHVRAIHTRNAIALARDPVTGAVWAGIAGQDELEHGHPYELFDAFTAHAGTVDYGWPACYERRRAAQPGTDCGSMALARVVFPAYVTPIGAVFYPLQPHGKYAFPATYRGGAFVTWHGSWHVPLVAPRVVFVPMHGGSPAVPVDWDDPGKQWRPFIEGFQNWNGYRIGRPTGIAVGPQGSLFVADDRAGAIYRIRPARSP